MGSHEELERRVTSVENELAVVRHQVEDARVLAVGADRDASDSRAEFRAQRGLLQALRTTQLEQAEKLTAMDARLAGVDVRLAGMDERAAGVDVRLAGVDERLAGVDVRLAGVDERLAGLEESVSAMGARLAAMGARLAGMGGRVSGMDARLCTVEGRLSEVGAGVQLIVRMLEGMGGRDDSAERTS